MWFVLLFLGIAAVNGVPTARVVGGQDAPDGKYVYQVSLNIFGAHICGGSIVSKRFILTAAHCVIDVPVFFVTIIAGTNSLSQGGQVYKVDKFYIHDFTPETVRNDIALIRTSTEIEFNDKVQPIKISEHNFHAHGDPAVLSGWGYTQRIAIGEFALDHKTWKSDENSTENTITSFTMAAEIGTPDKLQEIKLKIFEQSECAKQWWNLPESQICTLTEEGEGACMGDSGGPLVADGVQIGIVSYGDPCARGYPDVYTRVFYYADWINKIIN